MVSTAQWPAIFMHLSAGICLMEPRTGYYIEGRLLCNNIHATLTHRLGPRSFSSFQPQKFLPPASLSLHASTDVRTARCSLIVEEMQTRKLQLHRFGDLLISNQ